MRSGYQAHITRGRAIIVIMACLVSLGFGCNKKVEFKLDNGQGAIESERAKLIKSMEFKALGFAEIQREGFRSSITKDVKNLLEVVSKNIKPDFSEGHDLVMKDLTSGNAAGVLRFGEWDGYGYVDLEAVLPILTDDFRYDAWLYRAYKGYERINLGRIEDSDGDGVWTLRYMAEAKDLEGFNSVIVTRTENGSKDDMTILLEVIFISEIET